MGKLVPNTELTKELSKELMSAYSRLLPEKKAILNHFLDNFELNHPLKIVIISSGEHLELMNDRH